MTSLVSRRQMKMMLILLASNKKAKNTSLKKSEKSGVGMVVESPDGRILIGRCTLTGLWNLPGGEVENGETHLKAAFRELKEETGLSLPINSEVSILEDKGNCKSFYLKLKNIPNIAIATKELDNIGFYPISDILDMPLRSCSASTLKEYSNKFLIKSKKISDMLIVEKFKKNIIRSGQVSDAVFEMNHGDALKLIGNGTFRIIRDAVKGMGDDSIKDIKFGNHVLHIRKHANDVYSGRIDDGLKTIHQFVNRSIPTLTAELMSVFEWYSEDKINFDDEKLPDETIVDGIEKLINNYKNHNISNIYEDMETIREEIRNGNAVDLQQAEQKIMKLFDRLDETIKTVTLKHNDLAEKAGNDLDDLEQKLRDLQSKIDLLTKKPSTIKAIAQDKVDANKIHDEFYNYLSKPKIIIEPNGKITISFDMDWQKEEKVNFLQDMRVKVVRGK